jgi:4-amino-4-deoxy-L-arabinose transferase-like glycosyltransferase
VGCAGPAWCLAKVASNNRAIIQVLTIIDKSEKLRGLEGRSPAKFSSSQAANLARSIIERLKNLGPEFWRLTGLTLVGLAVFFWRLGTPGLMDPDEGRYAEIAREMLVSKDWLVPRLNFLPYLEKPPLVYWLTALSFQGFGLSEWAARLPVALSAWGCVYLGYGLGRALSGAGPAWYGALVLATAGGFVVLGRILTLDMTLALWVNLAVGLGYLAWSRERPSLWKWAYAAVALGVLTKGPVAAVLPVLIWGVWGLSRGRGQWFAWLRPWGVLLAAGLTLPWFLRVGWEYPQFFKFFLWEHHVARFAGGAFHSQSFFFYGPVLLGLFIPWTMLLFWTLQRQWDTPGPDRRFLLLWFLVVLVFFSLSRGKLVPYILPAFLPLALLVGEALWRLKESGWPKTKDRHFTASLAAWAAIAGIMGIFYLLPPAKLAGPLQKLAYLGPAIPAVLALMFLMPVSTLVFKRVELLFAGALALTLVLPGAIDGVALQRSPREMGQVLKAHWRPGAVLIGWQLYSQGLSFYSRQPFHILDFPTELDFGRSLRPDSGHFLASPAEVADLVRSRPAAFIFVKERVLFRVKEALGGDFRILARYKDCLLATPGGK